MPSPPLLKFIATPLNLLMLKKHKTARKSFSDFQSFPKKISNPPLNSPAITSDFTNYSINLTKICTETVLPLQNTNIGALPFGYSTRKAGKRFRKRVVPFRKRSFKTIEIDPIRRKNTCVGIGIGFHDSKPVVSCKK